MSKQIKLIITLLTALLFLTACTSSISTSTSASNNTKTQGEPNDILTEKINNKQKYIVVQKINDSGLSTSEIQDYIENVSNNMISKNYELKFQNIIFTEIGTPHRLILTFEYKGD